MAHVLNWRKDTVAFLGEGYGHIEHFVAFCLDDRTLTVRQLMGFPLNH